MTRDEALDRIHDPLAAPLTEDEQRAFESWLERDEELCALHVEQQALFAAMDGWADDVEPSTEFDRKLWARIEAEKARPSWTQALASWLSWPRAAWVSCAAAAAIAAMVFLGPAEQPEPQSAVTKASLSVDDAQYMQELDRALDDMEMLMDFDALAPDRS
ncbi:MAG: hypothetical protein R2724_32020 [Bryobacterales bacterium]